MPVVSTALKWSLPSKFLWSFKVGDLAKAYPPYKVLFVQAPLVPDGKYVCYIILHY